ncbi:unnamed protein product [Litomosoides sigmodontis]|uniref:Major facilitator superfamily (MFS) profile domain-containing protein n=1 Tax=Litomosoides sigmodontis TaxID=42156 RepID=A0A3P6TGN4_LITSI|nr:unnamed protein product [Litomosoides sigmodontis]
MQDSDHFTGKLNYEQGEKSALLWALGFGTFIGVWPFNYLYLQFGARYVFFAAGFLSAFSTLVIPLAAYMGLAWFIGARVLQLVSNVSQLELTLYYVTLKYRAACKINGVAYGADFAAIGVITIRWASLKQSGVFIAVLTSFNSLSTLITNPISGLLCESPLGWPAVYYVHAIFGILIFTVWVLFYRDQPEIHKNVSGIELEKIRREKSEGYISCEKYVPYWAIIKNPAILIIWLNAFVEIVSALFLLSYGPTYIKYVLNISVEGTGFLVALQGSFFLPCRIAAGFMSDQIKCINEYKKMIIFNTLSLAGAGVFYGIVGFIPPERTLLSVFAIAITHAIMAFNVGGFYKCGTFVARQHSHFVISNIQFIKCIALFVSPLLVAVFVTDDSAQVAALHVAKAPSTLVVEYHFLGCDYSSESINRRLADSHNPSMDAFGHTVTLSLDDTARKMTRNISQQLRLLPRFFVCRSSGELFS